MLSALRQRPQRGQHSSARQQLRFADDSAIMTSSARALIPKNLQFRQYCAGSFVEIGDPKSQATVFGALPAEFPSLSVSDSPIAFVPTITLVGVTFTSTAHDVLKEHYIRKEKTARNMANSCLALEGFVGTVPPQILLSLYRARVDPHLVAGCEVALDVRPTALNGLERVQHTYLRRLLGLGPRSQRVPLFSETGIWPLRFRRAWLAVRYLAYLLRRRPPIPYSALEEAWTLATHGHPSWYSDLHHALKALPVPVNLPLQPFPTEAVVQELLSAVEDALARHIYEEVQASGRLPLLKARFDRLPFPPKLDAVCKQQPYLSVTNAEHREALVRLLTSDHKLAVEELRRVPPAEAVPHLHRICRFCCRRGAVEDEVHVLVECGDARLVTLRDQFYAYVRGSLYPDLDRIQFRMTSSMSFLHFLLSREKLAPSLAKFVHDVFTLVDEVPIVHIRHEADLLQYVE